MSLNKDKKSVGTGSVYRVTKKGGLEGEEFKDAFQGMYLQGLPSGDTPAIIEPPIDPCTLKSMCQESEALIPCIDAMVQNVSGTGYYIKDSEGEVVPTEDPIHDFFKECSPGTSFLSERKRVREDFEHVGYAAWEVVRNANEKIICVKHKPVEKIRLVALDEAVPVTIEVSRNGKKVELVTHKKERRFAEMVSGKLIYYREYGASRYLHKETGKWSKQPLKLEDRAQEIVFIRNRPDHRTPYAYPTWWHNVPSVLSSRKAEETNLSYFDNGGIPPVFITISGGQFTEDSKTLLESIFSGSTQDATGAAIFEAYSTDASLDGKTTPPKLDVHKFGQDMTPDLYDGYLKSKEASIRRSWRLGPLFVGLSQDYNYATARASYLITEMQVFAPARTEEDQAFNLGFIGDLLADIAPGYTFHSNPLNPKDVDQILQSLGLAAGLSAIDNEELIDQLNSLLGLDLKPAEEIPPPQPAAVEDGSTEDEDSNLEELATKVAKAVFSSDAKEAGGLLPKITKLKKSENAILRRLIVSDLLRGGSTSEVTKLL
jgi:capsid portal protein